MLRGKFGQKVKNGLRRKEHFEEDCPGVDWKDRGSVSGVVDDGFDAGGYNEGRARCVWGWVKEYWNRRPGGHGHGLLDLRMKVRMGGS